MSRKKAFDPATFAPGCLTLSQQYISVKDYERAFYQLWEAHEAIFQTPALIAEHSEGMGQLLRTISVEAKSVQTNSSDSISFMGMYQRTLIREHLGQHMLLHPAQPLPAIWSHIALSAATTLKGQDNWLARHYAELGYAHPLGVEADQPALRQIILETLPASLINAEGKTITDMMYEPLDKLRASGVFRRDPALALEYNHAIEARPPQSLSDRMALNVTRCWSSAWTAQRLKRKPSADSSIACSRPPRQPTPILLPRHRGLFLMTTSKPCAPPA